VSCACPVSGCFDLNRKKIKSLLTELSREIPTIRSSMIKALANMQPRYLLAARFTLFFDPENAANRKYKIF
jgi:tRNA 2-thiocytidine biosynthesis protein TtcA